MYVLYFKLYTVRCTYVCMINGLGYSIVGFYDCTEFRFPRFQLWIGCLGELGSRGSHKKL